MCRVLKALVDTPTYQLDECLEESHQGNPGVFTT
jgi:hypothetical protein